MSLFSSDRERRLWLWTLAVVIAIYSTLGLTGRLAGALRERGLLGLFVLGMFLVAATIVVQGLALRPRGFEIAAALGIAAAYLLVFMRMALEERTHLIEYGVVGAFLYGALAERASQGRRVSFPALFAIFGTAILGLLDECIQWALPERVFDPRDILFNLLAGTMSVLGCASLRLVRRRRESQV